MSTYNSNQGGYGNASNKKQEKVNQWVGVGIIRPRSANKSDPINFVPFRNGGGVINADLAITQPAGLDENGMPKMKNVSIPISIKTNKNITAQQLQSIVNGMKVRVVGPMEPETYTNKKTGQLVSSLVCNAYVFEVIDSNVNSASPQGYYPPQGQQMPPQGGYYPPQGQQMSPQGNFPPQGYYPPQGQQMPPQGGYYPPQGQQMPPQGFYPPQPGNNPYARPAQAQPQTPQQGTGYYPHGQNPAPQNPGPQYPPIPAQAQTPASIQDIDDLPAD